MDQSGGKTSVEGRALTLADFETLRLEAVELQKTVSGRAVVSQVASVFSSVPANGLIFLLGVFYKVWKAGSLDRDLYDLICTAVNEPGTVPYHEKYAIAQLSAYIIEASKASSTSSQDAVIEQG